jgi:hypothetical protein
MKSINLRFKAQYSNIDVSIYCLYCQKYFEQNNKHLCGKVEILVLFQKTS